MRRPLTLLRSNRARPLPFGIEQAASACLTSKLKNVTLSKPRWLTVQCDRVNHYAARLCLWVAQSKARKGRATANQLMLTWPG